MGVKRRRLNSFRCSVGLIALILVFSVPALAEEPKAGDVVDSSNIEQYSDYLPSFLARFVKDGWGFEKPVVIHVTNPKPWPITKRFAEATKNNIGKVTLTSDGLLEDYEEIGLPFPNPQEPDLALKIMWNRYYKDLPDDWSLPVSFKSYTRRKGGAVNYSDSIYDALQFSGRTYVEPYPVLPNPHGLRQATLSNSLTPPNKDMATLTWRYVEPLKMDDMWTYVPTLRRTLRMVSSERANPIRGLPLTWDELFGFDGKVPQFTYKLLREQKILVLADQNKTGDDIPPGYEIHPVLFGEDEPYQVMDTYVVSINSKDPRYPNSDWHLWVSKRNYAGIYAETYNRRGEFWKGYFQSFQVRPLGDTGEQFPISICSGVCDFITQYWYFSWTGELNMNTGLNPIQFDPGSLGAY
ncbi:MAG: DUF1329 domain-containing protein [Desulfobacterales bacterium]